MSEIRLLSTDELLRRTVAEVTEIRVREHAVIQKIAELDQRGAAAELGYKNLPQVLRHAVRWDPRTAKKWVEQAGLLECALIGIAVMPGTQPTQHNHARMRLGLDFGCEVLAFPDQAGAKHPTFSA